MSDKTPDNQNGFSEFDDGLSELDRLFSDFGVNVPAAEPPQTEPQTGRDPAAEPPQAEPQAAEPQTEREPSAEPEPPSEAPPEERVVFFPKVSPEKRKFLEALRRRDEAPKKKPQLPDEAAMPDRPLRRNEMLVYDSELDEIDYYDPEDLPEARDYHPVRLRRHGHLGVARGLMYALFVISVSVILACMGWLFAADVLALNKPDETAIVIVERYVPFDESEAYDAEGREITCDIEQVATALKAAGIIEYKWLFKTFSQFSSADVKIDPGTYDVSAKLDYRALVTALQSGSESMEITEITFPEGYSMAQIFQLLDENMVCSADDLYDTAANTDFDFSFLEDVPLGDASRLEGYLFPDTYQFYQGEAAETTINRFLRNFNNRMTEDMKKQADNLGMSLAEVVTVASLVEKEAGEGERENVASVIYNRLDDDMPLQLDSTVNYVKGSSTFQLTNEDLEIDSPYNTYKYEGLPPGPICNPGLASITAALNPASTGYYYFAIDAESGKTEFFKTYSGFSDFVASQNYSTLD